MRISRFKFSRIAAAETIVAIIFFFLGLYFWTTGINNMRYVRNFHKAVEYYGANRFTDIEKAVKRAENAKEEDKIPLLLFKANFLVERRQIEEALKVYDEVESSPGTTDFEENAAKVGRAVCELYRMEASGKIDLEKLQSLEQELNNAGKDEFPEAYVVLGHIYLKQAQDHTNDDNRASNLGQAMDAFDTAEGYHDPEKTPLARGACYSLYLGKALAYYEGAELKYRQEKRRAGPHGGDDWLFSKLKFRLEAEGKKYPERAAYLLETVQDLRRALLLRIPHPQVALAVSAVYDRLLAIPWLEGSQRAECVKKVEYYIQTEQKWAELFNVGDMDRQEMQNFNTRIADFLSHGLGTSYFFLGDYNKAIDKVFNSYQLKFSTLREEWANKKKADTIGLDDFIVLNNYLAVHYRQKPPHTDYIKQALQMLKETLPRVASHSFFIAGYEHPVTPEQILYHNLYLLKWRETEIIMGRKASKNDCLYKK